MRAGETSNEAMRILYLNHNLREHGTYFRALDIARALARRGHEATLLTASPRHWYRTCEEQVGPVRVIETPSWNPVMNGDDGWGPLDVLYRMGRVLREDYDLLYAFAHPPTIYLPARLAQLARRKPVVVDWCDAYRDGIFAQREERRARGELREDHPRLQRWAEARDGQLERRILRKAEGVTVISEPLRREALAEGVTEERLLCFPSGANVESFGPRDKRLCRRALGVEGKGPLVGYTANYNPDEALFLEALSRAFERHPTARLLAACPPFSRSLVERYGLGGGRLIELGLLPFARMPEALGACDVLAIPLEENAMNQARWPNKFGDFLAASRPIAACAIGDLASYFPPADAMRQWLALPDAGHSALATSEEEREPIGLATACRANALGDALGDLLAHPEKWESMGAASRRVAEKRLSWQDIAGRIEPFIEKILFASR